MSKLTGRTEGIALFPLTGGAGVPTAPHGHRSLSCGWTARRAGFLLLLTLGACTAQAQGTAGMCQATANAAPLRAEGLTEPIGDVVLTCSGFTPTTTISGNLTLFLPVNVTNRIDANNFTSQVVLSIDTSNGSGFTPLGPSALVNSGSVIFNSLGVTVPGSGNFSLKISGVRIAASQLSGSTQQVVAHVAGPLSLNPSQVTVAMTAPGLYATLASAGIACVPSTVPSSITISSFFAAGTTLASTRLTEGFSSAFAARTGDEDTGTRFLIKYSGFPANASIYIPDMVAGSDAAVPTSGGDLGLPQSGGQWTPNSGTLLLVRVRSADATGLGGTPLAKPTGGTAILDSASEVPLLNGSGYAVYEVAEANASMVERAQFPTFVGMANSGGAVTVAQESISLAPVSTETAATSTDPMPRFSAVTPTSDCGIDGDCQASYFPKLSVDSTAPIQLTGIAGGAMTGQPGYVPVHNIGGGFLVWSATANYTTGSGWITLDPASSVMNNGSLRVFAQPQALTYGTYQANVVITAGTAGSVTIPVVLTVQPAPPPTVTITKIVNAATFANTPLVSGSVATLMGTHLAGTNVVVTVNNQPCTLLYAGDTQINFVVPDGLGSRLGYQGSASVVVTVDGTSSAPATVVLAPAYPAIFAHGIRNQDYSENLPSAPAQAGSFLQIWGLGMPTGATISAQIGNQMNLVPAYAGPAPDVPGVQQINLRVPVGLTPGTNQLILCATVGGQPYCSDTYSITTN